MVLALTHVTRVLMLRCACARNKNQTRTVSAPDLLKTEGLSFTILTRNASSRPQAAPDRQIGGHTPDQRPVQSPRVLGEARQLACHRLRTSKSPGVLKQLGARCSAQDAWARGPTSGHRGQGPGHTWKTERPRLMERGVPTVLNAKMASSCKTWTGDKVTVFILVKFQVI